MRFWSILFILISAILADKVKLSKEEFEARALEADSKITFISKETLLESWLKPPANTSSSTDRPVTSWRFVFYGAGWCKYCKRLSPRWLKLQEGILISPDFKNLDFQVGKYDCSHDNEFCQSMKVDGYPTLILYRNGQHYVEYFGEQNTKPMALWLVNTIKNDAEASEVKQQVHHEDL